MLIKEFRTPMPLEVEEYRVAQLYSIQKMSKLNTTSADDGIKILINEPYTGGPGGDGQFTKKIYYLYHKIPGWLQFLIPKNCHVIEEAWNAYPYSKTIYHIPLFSSAEIVMETNFLPDNGTNDSVYLREELEKEAYALIDICDESLAGKPFASAELDPRQFVSVRTKRGPLTNDWINTTRPIMCSYKIVKVNFPYWGLQTKVERFFMNRLVSQLHEIHCNVWLWQDEWHGMTMDEVRLIEKKAQEELDQLLDLPSASINGKN